jgi:hypothetical protein
VTENQKLRDSEQEDRQASLRHLFSQLRGMSPSERAEALRKRGDDGVISHEQQEVESAG